MKQMMFATALVVFSAIMPLSAHHVVSAKFDPAKPLKMQGAVTKVDWLNPHVHIFIDVKDARGVVTNWAVELESVVDLVRNDWNENTVKVGDTIAVEGPAARNG